jgi:hypothetical protein
MNIIYEAADLPGWNYHNPDRLIDARGRDISEAGVVPLDAPITRIMPSRVARWISDSGLSAYAVPMPYAFCDGEGEVLVGAAQACASNTLCDAAGSLDADASVMNP